MRILLLLTATLLACDAGWGDAPTGVDYQLDVVGPEVIEEGEGYWVLHVGLVAYHDDPYGPPPPPNPGAFAYVTLAVDAGDEVRGPAPIMTNATGYVTATWTAHYDLGPRELRGCARSDRAACQPRHLLTIAGPSTLTSSRH